MRKSIGRFRSLLLFVAPMILFSLVPACGGEDSPPTPPPVVEKPADAWGFVTDALPDGAELVSTDEFDALNDGGQLKVVTPEVFADEQKTEEQRAAEDAAEIKAFVTEAKKQRADLPEYFEKKILGNPVLVDGVSTPMADGNVSIQTDPIVHEGLAGRVLWGKRAKNRVLADTIRQGKSRDNHIGVIKNIYNAIPANDQPWIFEELGLPQVQDLEQMNLADLQLVLGKITSGKDTLLTVFPLSTNGKPAGYPASCQDEIGYPSAAPSSSEYFNDHQKGKACSKNTSPKGLLSVMEWPLKYYTTCVKDQGSRGACGSFGTVAAVEVLLAKTQGKWVNLSEQDLYYQSKAKWEPTNFGDGLFAPNLWKNIKKTGYKIPYESAWPYNGSPNRTENQDALKYVGSCKYQAMGAMTYANSFATPQTQPYCSETTHQGRTVCKEQYGFTFCGYANPSQGGVVGLDKIWEIWQETKSEQSVDFIKTVIAAGYPVTLSFNVPQHFKDRNTYAISNNATLGYIDEPGNTPLPVLGGHTVLVTGYFTNAEIQAKDPSIPAGTGGGYFIIKNSWSPCWGDGGYGYVSANFVKLYAWSAMVLESIQ